MPVNPMKQKGFSLQELLVVMSMIAVAAAFAIPKLVTNVSAKEIAARKQSSLQELNTIMQNANAEMGVFPVLTGPFYILNNYSKYLEYQPGDLSPDPNFIGVCPTGNFDAPPQKTFKRLDGVIITNVSTEWLPDADRNAGNGSMEGDMVCVAIRGIDSNTLGSDAYWVYLPRKYTPSGGLNMAPGPTSPKQWYAKYCDNQPNFPCNNVPVP